MSKSAPPVEAPAPSAENAIARERLVEMFQNMEQKSGWDLSKEMVWGYFFTHAQEGPFDALQAVLEQRGYRVVERFQDPESRVWFLHVERIEAHSVDSLHRRNEELAALAQAHGVTYDGMDVGPQ